MNIYDTYIPYLLKILFLHNNYSTYRNFIIFRYNKGSGFFSHTISYIFQILLFSFFSLTFHIKNSSHRKNIFSSNKCFCDWVTLFLISIKIEIIFCIWNRSRRMVKKIWLGNALVFSDEWWYLQSLRSSSQYDKSCIHLTMSK